VKHRREDCARQYPKKREHHDTLMTKYNREHVPQTETEVGLAVGSI
jgi:hypothetical protein